MKQKREGELVVPVACPSCGEKYSLQWNGGQELLCTECLKTFQLGGYLTNSYKENPKTKGSGIVCVIPQKGRCPHECKDCFFQGGRSYLEPLEENTPNMCSVEEAEGRVVRINDGNDSSNDVALVMAACEKYKMKFYNTSSSRCLNLFNAPVVLTVNPGTTTDVQSTLLLKIPKNLMFVRVRVNTWNRHVVKATVEHYARYGVPVVFTFMAYLNEESIPLRYRCDYELRKRTLNNYWAIKGIVWEEYMQEFKSCEWVHSCGESRTGTISCRTCGNCLREYFATMERMRG